MGRHGRAGVDASSPFLDREPVVFEVELSRGGLAALLDDPVLLRGDVDESEWFTAAKLDGVRGLRESAMRAGVA